MIRMNKWRWIANSPSRITAHRFLLTHPPEIGMWSHSTSILIHLNPGVRSVCLGIAHPVDAHCPYTESQPFFFDKKHLPIDINEKMCQNGSCKPKKTIYFRQFSGFDWKEIRMENERIYANYKSGRLLLEIIADLGIGGVCSFVHVKCRWNREGTGNHCCSIAPGFFCKSMQGTAGTNQDKADHQPEQLPRPLSAFERNDTAYDCANSQKQQHNTGIMISGFRRIGVDPMGFTSLSFSFNQPIPTQ